MNAVTKLSASMALREEDLIAVLSDSLYPGAQTSSIQMVLGYCKAAGLDPMQKPVHIVPMWDAKSGRMRDVVMPGIGMYRTQAARAGCAGVTEPEFGPDVVETIGGQQITFPAWCRVTVRRRLPTGEIVDFTAKEFWKENYAVKGGKEKSIAPNAMWTKRPYGQLAKCAEAQALRKAFPEIGSAPTADEMEGKSLEAFAYTDPGTGEITPAPTPAARPALEAYPADKFQANLPKWRDLVQNGSKTPEQIRHMLTSRATLTDAQLRAIADLGVQDVTPKPDPMAEHADFVAALDGDELAF